MSLTDGNLDTLIICAVLTALASALTVVFSVVCGATLAFHAQPTVKYGVVLTLLLVPFALGGSVWAYAVSQLTTAWGLQEQLVSGGTLERAAVLLLLCLARTVPLGAFLCATTLQRYTSDIRAYFRVHHLSLPFFLLCGLGRIPRSLFLFLGLFGGALTASEASLATFLYRANPGTAPETANIMLARLFREVYAYSGPASLLRVAMLGAAVSLLFVLAALAGAWAGRRGLALLRMRLSRTNLLTRTSAVLFFFLPSLTTLCVVLPGVAGLVGLVVQPRFGDASHGDTLAHIVAYQGIVTVGLLVAVITTTTSLAAAIRLRYARRDWLVVLERGSLPACVLLLPAFVPVLSVVAVLGTMSQGRITGIPGYLSLLVSHLALHYSVFQFICMTLVAAIPERHVSWQRTMQMRYGFSLATDGFKRHAAVVACLIGLGTVQVITDGSVSRWFAHLVAAPEEALYAAVFGRLSSAVEAAVIAWAVTAVSTLVCAVLAWTYVQDLKRSSRYA